MKIATDFTTHKSIWVGTKLASNWHGSYTIHTGAGYVSTSFPFTATSNNGSSGANDDFAQSYLG
jgi:hypothetical protein